MKNNNLEFIWSIGWWLEDGKAWFVDGMNNALFCVDMDTRKCEQICVIPNPLNEWTYRLNSYCIKCGRDIFCIPGYGNCIWIYNLDDHTFTELDIDKPYRYHFSSYFWKVRDSIFIVTGDWNKVIEVSIDQRTIVNYYTLCEKDSVRRSILVGNKIYAVSEQSSSVYEFDVITKKVITYYFPDFEKKLFAICFDGEKFWMSGYQKNVYIWDKENNSTSVIYLPLADVEESNLHLFNFILYVGGYIWFIPTAKGKIMYANKEKRELSVFEINKDAGSDLSKQPCGIPYYLLEYVKDDRYIGLFFARSRRIFEIDTEQLSYQWIDYKFSDQCIEQCYENRQGIFNEGDILCETTYRACIGNKTYSAKSIKNVGIEIYVKCSGGDI